MLERLDIKSYLATGQYCIFASDESIRASLLMSDLSAEGVYESTFNNMIVKLSQGFFKNVSVKQSGGYDGTEINKAVNIATDKEFIKAIQAMSYVCSFIHHCELFKTDENEYYSHIESITAIGLTGEGHASLNLKHPSSTDLLKFKNAYKDIKNYHDQDFFAKRKTQVQTLANEASKRFNHRKEEYIDAKGNVHQWHVYEEILSDYNITSNHLRQRHSDFITKAINEGKENIYLLGAPGIGKTTSILKNIKQGTVFIYTTPRTVIVNDVMKKFASMVPNSVCITSNSKCNSNQIIMRDKEGAGSFVQNAKKIIGKKYEIISTEDIDDSHIPGNYQLEQERCDKGYFKRKSLVTTVLQRIEDVSSLYIHNCTGAVCITYAMQAIGKVPDIDKKEVIQNILGINLKSHNVTKEINSLVENYQTVIIMIDEISGDETGIETVKSIKSEISRLRKADKEKKLKFILVIADASISDSSVISAYFKKTNPFFAICQAKNFGDIQYVEKGNNVYINVDTYPAKSLTVECKIAKSMRHQAEMTGKIITDIIDFNKNRKYLSTEDGTHYEQLIVFVQDKQEIENMGMLLQNLNISFASLHSNITSKSKKELEENMMSDNAPAVLLMTSSGARGMSFKYATTIMICVPRFQIESQMMEIMQTVFRGRGDKKVDENEAKKLIFYYNLSDNKEEKWIDKINDVNELEKLRTNMRVTININTYTMLLLIDACLRTRIYGCDLTSYKVVPLGRQGTASGISNAFSNRESNIRRLRIYKDKAVSTICEISRKAGYTIHIKKAEKFLEIHNQAERQMKDVLAGRKTENLPPFAIISGVIVFQSNNVLISQTDDAKAWKRRYTNEIKEKAKEALKYESEDDNNALKELCECIESEMRFDSIYSENQEEKNKRYIAYPLDAIGNEYPAGVWKALYEKEKDCVPLLQMILQSEVLLDNCLPVDGHDGFSGIPFLTFTSEDFEERMNTRYHNTELISSPSQNLLNLIFSEDTTSIKT